MPLPSLAAKGKGNIVVFGSGQPVRQSMTTTQMPPLAPQRPLDAKGDNTGKPLVFGTRQAPLLRPAQQLALPRLAPEGPGGGGQGTSTLNRPATAERNNCLEKSFVFGPGPSLVQQMRVAMQAKTPTPPPPSETIGEDAGKLFGPCTGHPHLQRTTQQLAPPLLSQVFEIKTQGM